MIEAVLPHLVSGLALAVVGWSWTSMRSLRQTVHDLELRQVRTETQASAFERAVTNLQEHVSELPTRRDLESVKDALCQRIDDLRS